MKKDYYIGLDMGTDSVGWATSDEEYRLIRAKGHNLIGTRLFKSAETASERRSYRSSRRRLHRANARLKLLRMLFRDEISKVDPNFYLRLKESFYLAEDKNGLSHDKNTLFADKNYTDKDFHKQFPTIWHLRQALIKGEQKYDIRLYFLAIQHILKHRGHFLFGGEINNIDNSFDELYQDLVEKSKDFITLDPTKSEEFRLILSNKSDKRDQKKQIANSVIISHEEDNIDPKIFPGLFTGSEITFNKLFKLETDDNKKFSFLNQSVDEKIDELSSILSDAQLDIVISAKKVYDFIVLKDILSDSNNISDAMVKNYIKHSKQLKELQSILKPHDKYYKEIFKSDGEKSYNAYIGKSKKYRISQEDFNKYLFEVFTKIKYDGDLVKETNNRTLLPKQKGQAKGSIPMQLHRNELKEILKNLGRDYPSFAKINPNESENYNNTIKKILQIHSFRVPYYCGPLVKRKYDNKGNLIEGGKSEFSWADEEIKQIVYPWNFKELVDTEKRAEDFIRRMTNECTYLRGEDVLPKSSLIYQKYAVLNELNNLKINGIRLSDINKKQQIFESVFNGDNALSGNFKIKTFANKLIKESIIDKEDNLSGISEDKYLPKLSTHFELKKILGLDYLKKYSTSSLEKVVEIITIIGDEKEMCKNKIKQTLNCNDEIASKLCRLNLREWSSFSEKLLSGIKFMLDGVETTVLDALYDTNYNFMELMSRGLGEAIEKFNDKEIKDDKKISYDDVNKLYCSPSVKRSIWQAVKIVEEIIESVGYAPKKIFIEVTRENESADTKQKNMKLRARRKEQLKIALKNSKDILGELNNLDDNELNSKKIYLYFMQHGLCAYTGERLSLEDLNDCDIDHVYPRSLTKDDSITNNLVLVKSEYNREKTNIYPIKPEWQNKMQAKWLAWLKSGSITKEKYLRLTRKTPLTEDELGKFISRQIVETAQSVKSVANLFKSKLPETKIITVKAQHVSDLRKFLGYDKINKKGEIYHKGRPEFIKIRDLNDLHHAKDAYLNIVVGNVYDRTFTPNPIDWVRSKGGSNYTLNTDKIFRESESYKRISDGEITSNPKINGWNFIDSINIVSDIMKQNGVLWTRMPFTQSGEISDLQPVSKSKDRMPLKNTKRLSDTEKYGGYNSLKGAYFSLIEFQDNKERLVRKIIQIPIIYQSKPFEYLSKKYQNPRILIPKILMNSLFKINDMPLHLAGRSGDRLQFIQARQLFLDSEYFLDVKKILKIAENIKLYKKFNKEYSISNKYNIDKSNTLKIYEELSKKLHEYEKTPTLSSKINDIILAKNKFNDLDLSEQCILLSEFINIFKCNARTSNLSSIIDKSSFIAGNSISISNTINDNADIKLILQSPTGLKTKEIDLKKIK